MKKSFMKKWVKALRSGEYEQGKFRLVDANDNFCCLGVACDLVDHIGEWVDNGIWCFKSDDGELQSGELPKEIMEYTGIKSAVGMIPSLGSSLATLNDHGVPFSTIADIIEKHYKEI